MGNFSSFNNGLSKNDLIRQAKDKRDDYVMSNLGWIDSCYKGEYIFLIVVLPIFFSIVSMVILLPDFAGAGLMFGPIVGGLLVIIILIGRDYYYKKRKKNLMWSFYRENLGDLALLMKAGLNPFA